MVIFIAISSQINFLMNTWDVRALLKKQGFDVCVAKVIRSAEEKKKAKKRRRKNHFDCFGADPCLPTPSPTAFLLAPRQMCAPVFPWTVFLSGHPGVWFVFSLKGFPTCVPLHVPQCVCIYIDFFKCERSTTLAFNASSPWELINKDIEARPSFDQLNAVWLAMVAGLGVLLKLAVWFKSYTL